MCDPITAYKQGLNCRGFGVQHPVLVITPRSSLILHSPNLKVNEIKFFESPWRHYNARKTFQRPGLGRPIPYPQLADRKELAAPPNNHIPALGLSGLGFWPFRPCC